MPWQCRMIDASEGWPHDAQVGDMWYRTVELDEEHLSADYKANRRGKSHLWVQLPGGPMCLDRGYQSNTGWTVVGEAPNITVNPSINVIGEYHGWIQNGVITDDCEGRTYPHLQGGAQ